MITTNDELLTAIVYALPDYSIYGACDPLSTPMTTVELALYNAMPMVRVSGNQGNESAYGEAIFKPLGDGTFLIYDVWGRDTYEIGAEGWETGDVLKAEAILDGIAASSEPINSALVAQLVEDGVYAAGFLPLETSLRDDVESDLEMPEDWR